MMFIYNSLQESLILGSGSFNECDSLAKSGIPVPGSYRMEVEPAVCRVRVEVCIDGVPELGSYHLLVIVIAYPGPIILHV